MNTNLICYYFLAVLFKLIITLYVKDIDDYKCQYKIQVRNWLVNN